jgi:hypothetical protein
MAVAAVTLAAAVAVPIHVAVQSGSRTQTSGQCSRAAPIALLYARKVHHSKVYESATGSVPAA